jgi:hypothetical protein
MPTMTMEVRTDENGYFSKTVPFNPPGPFALTVRLTARLASPFATGLWGSLDIDARDGAPSNQQRAFVLWHGEAAPLGSWRLDGGDNIIVVTGKTRPRRANTRLVLEIDAAL